MARGTRRSLRLAQAVLDAADDGATCPALSGQADALKEVCNADVSRKRKVTSKPAPKQPSRKASKRELSTDMIEQALWQRGFKRVAGVDEAGRGPLAGPVVAAAVVAQPGVHIEGIMDSKQIAEGDRERLFQLLTSHPGISYGISVIDASIIDEINILEATMRSMADAIAALSGNAPDAVLVDGNRVPPGITAAHRECIIKGDSLCFSIAAASILAKVTRDRIMVEADARWPEYGFAQHKGYGTKIHMSMVHKHGPCPIHRLTFRPLPDIVAALADVDENKTRDSAKMQDHTRD